MAQLAVDQRKLVQWAHGVLDVHEEDTYVREIEDGEVIHNITLSGSRVDKCYIDDRTRERVLYFAKSTVFNKLCAVSKNVDIPQTKTTGYKHM